MGLMVVDASKCTHLVIGEPTRTANFLRALCVCDFVVRASWLRLSHMLGSLLPERDHTMYDYEFEKNFNFSLRQSLENQKLFGKGKVFSGITFYCSPHVRPPTQTLKEIVNAGSGELIESIPSVEKMLELRSLAEEDEMYIMVSCPDDIALVRDISASMPIYTSEIILSGALHQKVTFNTWRVIVPPE
eukprot:m.64482 g.64482  ORF g.64482 m.64482 type:complete len:188 (-) comp8116_c1_seq1:414-977(-)